MQLSGIHHLTAISADIRENHRFYTQMLGMRLVKRSVNQDDVCAYHLFYADAMGTPGHRHHVLRLANAAREARRASIVRTCLRVNGATRGVVGRAIRRARRSRMARSSSATDG